jgi:hypothetical protein
MSKRKPTVEFDPWFAELSEIAVVNGYEVNGVMFSWELSHWKELHEKGLTPQQAWDKE